MTERVTQRHQMVIESLYLIWPFFFNCPLVKLSVNLIRANANVETLFMAATSSPSHYYSPDSAGRDYHNGDLCRPYVSLSENNWHSTNFGAQVFLMQSRTPRTSPFAGNWSLPINLVLLGSSDLIGFCVKKQKPQLGESLTVLWPNVPWASSFSPAADPSLCTFVFALGLWNQ